ncbi:ATP-binding protein [Janthinobacterium sp. 17J80-10]|uniref:sensor histidine kinase n=1 Tax=Janthinobacterium sp. 17J80-10 TaxID=2497863 RepID=UPI0010053933|nr:ATP-binding protein [Janthinobacterium sp. 17J80-10]QAU33461.1 hypothetical protein EKL02_04265 [Janthinobacterium sp. 17J80-10]
MSSFTNISFDADLMLWRDRLTLLLELPAAERARELPAVLAQLRKLSAHAYMAMEANEGLITALEWQIQEFSNAHAVQCNSTIELEPDSIAPAGVLATTALRIFQEMLSNVTRHARATSVRIRIKLARALLQMDVTDDGIGALPESFECSRSYGVLGMRRQALNFGGSLHIFSVQGGGTHVCLRLPLALPGAAA